MRFFIENTDEPEKETAQPSLFSGKFSAAATFRLDFYAAIV
jgi:hypothetical protein